MSVPSARKLAPYSRSCRTPSALPAMLPHATFDAAQSSCARRTSACTSGCAGSPIRPIAAARSLGPTKTPSIPVRAISGIASTAAGDSTCTSTQRFCSAVA